MLVAQAPGRTLTEAWGWRRPRPARPFIAASVCSSTIASMVAMTPRSSAIDMNGRGDQAETRMVPAHQRFDASDAVRRGIARLEPGDELIVFDADEVSSAIRWSRRSRPAAPGEELGAIAALPWRDRARYRHRPAGACRRCVGRADGRCRPRRCRGIHAPRTSPDGACATGCAGRGAPAHGGGHRARRRDDEFVAADAGNEIIGADVGTQQHLATCASMASPAAWPVYR